jgi:hypothetical protein
MFDIQQAAQGQLNVRLIKTNEFKILLRFNLGIMQQAPFNGLCL